MRRLTSAQGSNSTAPESIAWMRREISCSQADPASASAGPSKLAKTSTASSARSSGPRRRASASTTLAALVMSEMIRAVAPPNKRVNLTIRPVTVCACARPAPSRLAGYAERWADKSSAGARITRRRMRWRPRNATSAQPESPDSPTWPWPDSLDALISAPLHHRLLFENAHVRVLDTRIAPVRRFRCILRSDCRRCPPPLVERPLCARLGRESSRTPPTLAQGIFSLTRVPCHRCRSHRRCCGLQSRLGRTLARECGAVRDSHHQRRAEGQSRLTCRSSCRSTPSRSVRAHGPRQVGSQVTLNVSRKRNRCQRRSRSFLISFDMS